MAKVASCRKHCSIIAIAIFFIASLSAEITIYFAPNGGFSKKNNQRTITLKNGEKVSPTLNNALLDLIQRTENGGQIKIAMYAFGYRPTQTALIEAAKHRNIKVKVVVDAVATWTEELRKDFKQRVLAEHKLAKKQNRVFDFQLAEIHSQAMIDRERYRELADGTIIYGTMHEKFGVFLPANSNIPLHAFCGSSNISWSASQIFAENRVIFKHEPAVARQLAEEFARLWNEYATPATPNCQKERFLTANLARRGEVRIVANSKPVDEDQNYRIDSALIELIERVDPKHGTLEVAMFSFTHTGLANKLLSLAARYPKIKVRILLDQTQIENDEHHQGVLGPYLEKTAYFRRLKNVEVRYKWRSNAYSWDPESNQCMLIHWRNLLLHHKCLVVNRKYMGIGSYNWSTSAEHRNLENIMVFDGSTPEQQRAITGFAAEYDAMWNSLKSEQAITKKLANPQVITGREGRKLKSKIIAAFQDPVCRSIMNIIDTNPQGCPTSVMCEVTGLSRQKIKEKLQILETATLIFATNKDKEEVYQLAD